MRLCFGNYCSSRGSRRCKTQASTRQRRSKCHIRGWSEIWPRGWLWVAFDFVAKDVNKQLSAFVYSSTTLLHLPIFQCLYNPCPNKIPSRLSDGLERHTLQVLSYTAPTNSMSSAWQPRNQAYTCTARLQTCQQHPVHHILPRLLGSESINHPSLHPSPLEIPLSILQPKAGRLFKSTRAIIDQAFLSPLPQSLVLSQGLEERLTLSKSLLQIVLSPIHHSKARKLEGTGKMIK